MLLVAFFLAVVFSLAVTVRMNLIVTYVLFVQHIVRAARVSIVGSRVSPGSRLSVTMYRRRLVVPTNIRMCRVGNPCFFNVTAGFRRAVTRLNSHPGMHVVHVHGIPFVSSANVRGLADLYGVSRGRGVAVMLSKMGRGMRGALRGSNFCRLLKGRGVYPGVGMTLSETGRVVGWSSSAVYARRTSKDRWVVAFVHFLCCVARRFCKFCITLCLFVNVMSSFECACLYNSLGFGVGLVLLGM